MLPNLLPVPHHKQAKAGSCLPAAVQMVLEYFGHSLSEDELAHILGTKSYGTPAPNLYRLEKDGFSVIYGSGTLSTIRAYIQRGVPCLIFVQTGDLPYWHENTGHVIVAIGIDEENIIVNDPAFDEAPQVIPLDYFLLAWSEFDHDML
jgi:ABC-type bacteriocin/lantibiotic exporter with double-glycine peptidase domain